MLAEDYFGFLNKPQTKILRRTNKRTQLSEQKISSRQRTRRQDEVELENLKKKYNAIIGKNKKKAKRKTSITYKIVQDHYYHGNKMKYYHYNDEGYNPKTKKIKERVQAKALMAFEKVKTQTCSQTKSIKKRISFQRPQNKVIKNEFAQLKNRNNLINYQPDRNQKTSSKVQRYAFHSSYSDSKILKQNNQRSRTLRKMKKQQKQKILQTNSRFDDYNLSSMKLQSQVNKSSNQSISQDYKSSNQSISQDYKSSNQSISQEFKSFDNKQRQINSFNESQNTFLDQKLSKSHISQNSLFEMIGLNSKISQEQKFKKEKNKQLSILNVKNISGDYNQIKKIQKRPQRQVSNQLFGRSRCNRQQNNINQANQFSQSSICLSNIIAQSARIFNPTFNGVQNKSKYQSPTKHSFVKLKTPSKIQQLQSKISQNTHKQIKPPKIERSSIHDSNINMSRLNYNQSKLSSIVNQSIYNKYNKYSPNILKNQPSCVKQIPSSMQLDNRQNLSKQIFEGESFNANVTSRKKKAFNLVSSIKMWNYHQISNSNVEGGINTNSQFEELMNKIHIHLKIINQLSDFVEMTAQMYEQNQSHWIQLQSFIVYKKFYNERIKIVDSLRKGVSCFHLQEAKISTDTLNKFEKKKGLIQLTNNIENINKMIQKSLENYFQEIKSSHQEQSIVNLSRLREKDVGVILNMLNQEFENILPKLDQLQSQNSIRQSQDYEDKQILCLRAYRIMQIVFLLSELEGRKVKNLRQEQIDSQDFEMYCKQYYGKFKETILYFN